MANSIQHVQTYLGQIIDEVYARESFSASLDAANNMVRYVDNASGTVLIPSIAFDGGLADYNKSSGASAGSITTKWEPYTLSVDRARQFTIDSVDSIEDAGFALAHMASEFLRTYVIPEIDAHRFAKYATHAGTKVAQAVTVDDIETAIETAISTLADKEVPKNRLKLYISNAAYSALKQSVQSRRDVVGLTVVNGVVTYDDIPVVAIPASRFHTEVTLGSTGYTPAGSEINFMLIDTASAVQVTRHVSNKIFTPDQNINADGYSWRYRVYHDAFVPTNKKNGIYVHSKA